MPELEGLAHKMQLGQPGGVLVVSKRPERHEYGSVCEAVRWARAGSVIEVLDGIYQEEILIEKVCCKWSMFLCLPKDPAGCACKSLCASMCMVICTGEERLSFVRKSAKVCGEEHAHTQTK
jgi:hypothetical protein